MRDESRNRRLVRLVLCGALMGAAMAGPVSAQVHVFSLGLSGGVAGSFDEEGGGFSNATFQVRFAMETTAHQNIAVRVGRMDFSDEFLSQAFDATIDYVTVAGEYLFSESGYESGFFMGLGFYDLSGERLDLTSADESSVGLQAGAVGEFRVTDRVFVFADAAIHYVNLNAAQIFGDLQVGLGFRF